MLGTSKIIVIGKNGYIAQRVADSKLGIDYKLIYTSTRPGPQDLLLNLENPETFNYEEIGGNDLIVLLAAISSPDACKNEYELTYKINVAGTIKFIENILKRGAKVLFFSSDTVYGNCEEECNENTKLNPVGEYAEMKLDVENRFRGETNLKIFRLSYVFSKQDKFMTYLADCAKNSKPAEIFHPFYRSVVYIADVVDSIFYLAKEWRNFDNQVFNICGDALLSRKDMAELYKAIVDKNLITNVVNPGNEFFKARPEIINMKSLYIERLLGRKPLEIGQSMMLEFSE
ncbi:NAD-dependent epimerase/dehydratase family protein [candidate division WS5 bacterium]|uniref:NAD-dependent epimerase/dehydratase family protein n=1 Tax=candidate division WS5 bacterium TaxID=2093353 RepID=A0A419DC32_9BACT|nr:MAG: NAD-dependent epimerase/dehydratase family protein [candidate division WS5 bacterium]